MVPKGESNSEEGRIRKSLRLVQRLQLSPVERRYNHPLVLAIRAASTRFAAPNFEIASDK